MGAWMLSRRHAIALIGAGFASPPSFAWAQQPSPPTAVKTADGRIVFDHGVVMERARQLSLRPYQPPSAPLPPELDALTFDDYRNIRFKRERAYFQQTKSPFRLELFHRGSIHKTPVVINLVREGVPAPIPYDSSLFEFRDVKIANRLPVDFGYAGARMLYPLNKPSVMDEFAAYLGSSYFRVLGKGQQYGVSARGVALGTGEDKPEEFPAFREYWIEEPEPNAREVVVHALLDGPSLSGAYRMVITPGEETTVAVGMTLFPRVDIPKLGIAPLTSMYFYGENDNARNRGFRPETHDSDGLLVKGDQDGWIWRPLMNPRALKKTSFVDPNVRGFGLLQRDRLFEHYQDLEARYDKRPSYWIEPKGDWGPGRIELVEIPTETETFDNIVAYWVPEAPTRAGETVRYTYTLRALALAERLTPKARALHTFTTEAQASGGVGGGRPDVRRFIVDFAGGELGYWLDEPTRVVTDTRASLGRIDAAYVVPNPETGGFRLFIDHAIEQPGAEAELRAVLKVGDRAVTETWVFAWTRPA